MLNQKEGNVGAEVTARWSHIGISVVSSVLVCVALVVFAAVFGSPDVEESANTSYSAGARYVPSNPIGAPGGTHSLLGVPVFDTLQGTGDRLPYQGSWAQSMFWPLRFLAGWEHYFLVRILLFAIPAVFLSMRTLLSWVPRARPWMMVAFGLLVNSSFGLYVRQNEWSDHYVQTVGTFAVSMFLFHRDFHDPIESRRFDMPWVTLLCIAIASNGVLTGHPGFWPISLFVWSATLGVCLTSRGFRVQLARWLRQVWVGASLLGAVSILTVAVVSADLLTELGAEFGKGRLARTQGLFGGYAFGGFYGLTESGSLPAPLKQLIATVLSTVLMPFFMLFDRVLPQSFRASDFRELSRVEFGAALVLVAVALGWRRLKDVVLKSVIARIVLLQVLIWLFVFASSRDLLPTTIAASGAWMTIPILLVLNVFLTFMLLADVTLRSSVVSGLGYANLVLAVVWFLFQFDAVSFGTSFQVPDRHISRLRVADAISESGVYEKSDNPPGRVVIANANFYNFLGFTAVGVPVAAPANQKIRDSRHLEADFALNFGIESPNVSTKNDITKLDDLLGFLNIEKVIVGSSDVVSSSGQMSDDAIRVQLSLTEEDLDSLVHAPMRGMDVYSRARFPAFVSDKTKLSQLENCPVLQVSCPLIETSSQVEPLSTPRLELCNRDCLWKYTTPAVADSIAVILPVTFDKALHVRDIDGTRVNVMDAGGFLAVSADGGLPATTLTIELDPDSRMISRVVLSYVNFAMFIMLLMVVIFASVAARRRVGIH
jgi:hypothetical protein